VKPQKESTEDVRYFGTQVEVSVCISHAHWARCFEQQRNMPCSQQGS